MCTEADLVARRQLTAPAEGDFRAWVAYTDAATTAFAHHGGTLSCARPGVTANLRGTGVCTTARASPEGWRFATGRDAWGDSHDSTASCVPHVASVCGFPGGAVAASSLPTACCLDGADPDFDGVAAGDNCASVANPDQADGDGPCVSPLSAATVSRSDSTSPSARPFEEPFDASLFSQLLCVGHPPKPAR
jgi:hypothetical protein